MAPYCLGFTEIINGLKGHTLCARTVNDIRRKSTTAIAVLAVPL